MRKTSTPAPTSSDLSRAQLPAHMLTPLIAEPALHHHEPTRPEPGRVKNLGTIFGPPAGARYPVAGSAHPVTSIWMVLIARYPRACTA